MSKAVLLVVAGALFAACSEDRSGSEAVPDHPLLITGHGSFLSGDGAWTESPTRGQILATQESIIKEWSHTLGETPAAHATDIAANHEEVLRHYIRDGQESGRRGFHSQ